jgi:hypothetical protein
LGARSPLLQALTRLGAGHDYLLLLLYNLLMVNETSERGKSLEHIYPSSTGSINSRGGFFFFSFSFFLLFLIKEIEIITLIIYLNGCLNIDLTDNVRLDS